MVSFYYLFIYRNKVKKTQLKQHIHIYISIIFKLEIQLNILRKLVNK